MSTKVAEAAEMSAIRLLVWVYFIMLIFEGVLRKWLLPGLSDPLLLARDPFVCLIYLLALGRGIFPTNTFVVVLLAVGAVAVIAGITVGSQDPLVTGYGFDAMFFHLPLIFIIPRVMKRTDVLKIGRCVLYLSIPMAVLMVIQFRSAPDAWINCGAGGGIGAQITGALGKIRPPGFFTFITGAAQFLALATAFLIFGLWKQKVYPFYLIIMAGVTIAVSAIVSTSRLALGGIGVVLIMVGIVVAYDRKSITNFLGMLIPIGLVLVVATNLDIFHEGREVFEARLKDAGDTGGGMATAASNWTTRAFGDFFGGIAAAQSAPVLGAGLGVGTNVGARMLSGSYGFLLAEGEWARVVLEVGPILAFPYLLIRLLICGSMFSLAARSARSGNALPMLLFGSSAFLVVSGQFSQTTSLGFAVLGAGMCLASANVDQMEAGAGSNGTDADDPRLLRQRPRSGCSPYARALHIPQEDRTD